MPSVLNPTRRSERAATQPTAFGWTGCVANSNAAARAPSRPPAGKTRRTRTSTSHALTRVDQQIGQVITPRSQPEQHVIQRKTGRYQRPVVRVAREAEPVARKIQPGSFQPSRTVDFLDEVVVVHEPAAPERSGKSQGHGHSHEQEGKNLENARRELHLVTPVHPPDTCPDTG